MKSSAKLAKTCYQHNRLSALHAACHRGARMFVGNYQPHHHSRSRMEWFLDWWLAYRTEAQLRALVQAVGFPEERIRSGLDPTGSITLLEAES